MIDFSAHLNLALVWGGLLSFGVFLYVFLDGFDLGTGILFPFAPTESCRDRMMNSIAPFWDGNETWLIFSGGGLLTSFPLAYSILMPAFYLPIFIMLLGLIFRGIAFEFRYKTETKFRRMWDYSFHFGSLIATFCQGLILGTFIQGIPVQDHTFSGSPLSFLTPFSVTTGVALVFGYALLGATWLIMKTEGETQAWARRSALYVCIYVLAFMALISLWTPFLNALIWERWFSLPNLYLLAPVPLVSMVIAGFLIASLIKRKEAWPFILSLALFMMNYLGLVISLWPWAVPFQISLHEAAAGPESLSLVLLGAGLALPLILTYTGYNYYLFRGKTSHEPYH